MYYAMMCGGPVYKAQVVYTWYAFDCMQYAKTE